MVKTLAKKVRDKLKRKPRGQRGLLEWLCIAGKTVGAGVLMFLKNIAHLIQTNMDALRNVSPFWVMIILGGAALTIIGLTEFKAETDRGPDPPKEVK